MIVTEVEAKEKWCPFVSITTNSDGMDILIFNSRGEGGNSVNTRCIASDCMAWETVDIDSVSRGYCNLIDK